ncbi:Integrase core domain-containing protein, partial [bacterium A37T11]
MVPFFEEHDLRLLRVIKTKAKSPQTNGICERFHRTIQEEFYAVAFRKKVYRSIVDLQTDLDKWLTYYNEERTHTGRYCYGKTPMQTFMQSKSLAHEKLLEVLAEDHFVPKPSIPDAPFCSCPGSNLKYMSSARMISSRCHFKFSSDITYFFIFELFCFQYTKSSAFSLFKPHPT